MIYVVSYSINPKRDIGPLMEAIKSASNGWAHYIDDTWLVASNESPQRFAERMFIHIGPNDRLLVAELRDYYGWLPNEAWEWLKKARDVGF